jgi:RNA polymerase sigma-70 factor, ECF subfamily
MMTLPETKTQSIVDLFDRHADAVFTLAYRIVYDRHLAEDVVQETFISAMQNLHTWRGDGPIAAWLYRIGYRNAIAQLRKRRDTPIDDDTLSRTIPPTTNTPEHAAIAGELASVIDAAIYRLPPLLRAVLVLRDVEELSTKHVASVLDLSESAVKMRLTRARTALRSDLQRYLL